MKPDFSKASPRPWIEGSNFELYSGDTHKPIAEFSLAGADEETDYANLAVAAYAASNIEAREATIKELVEALENVVAALDSKEMLGVWRFLYAHDYKWTGPVVDMKRIRAALARARGE